MYATYVLRTMNPATRASTLERAAEEFWPKLQEAPGFQHFFLVQQADDQTLGIILWESEKAAHAFMPVLDNWNMTLESLGHRRIAQGRGEVLAM